MEFRAKTHENLVKEVLNELLLERPARQETMQVGTEELGDKVNVLERRNENVGERDDVFVLDVLQELELSVGALGEDGCACASEGTLGQPPWTSDFFCRSMDLLKGFMLHGKIERKRSGRWSVTPMGERYSKPLCPEDLGDSSAGTRTGVQDEATLTFS